MRSWRPFCSGWPGLMRSMWMPRRSHQTASLLKPNRACGLAKGTPLSVRMALRQAELFEDPLEHGEGVDFLGGRQGLAAEQVATGEVADGERIAIAAIGEHELAFVVGAPQIVGSQRPGQRCALSLVAALAATADQAMAIEHRVHGADGRGRDIAMQPPQLLADLRRTPARVAHA